MISLAFLAHLIGKKFNVRVETDGVHALTMHDANGYKIVLPELSSMPLDTLLGYAYHEIAHVRYTDFGEALVQSGLVKHLANVYEDVRVERELMRKYPGTRTNIAYCVRHAFLEEPESEGVSPKALAELASVSELDEQSSQRMGVPADDSLMGAVNYILRSVRHLPTPQTPRAEVVSALEPLIAQAPTTQSTRDCVVLARQTAKVLQSLYPGEDLSDDEAEALDLGKVISKQVSEDVEARACHRKGFSEGVKVCGDKSWVDAHTSPMPADYVQEALGQACRLTARLHAYVQAYQLGYAESVHGRVNTRRLYRLPMHDSRVFVRRVVQPKINTAVHLLLDGSGSMHGLDARVASQAGYALMHALRQIRGVTVESYAFFGENLVQLCGEREALSHASLWMSDADGGTPLGGALCAMGKRILWDDGRRHIIIVMTDGDAEDAPEFVTLSRMVEGTVYCITVGSSAHAPDGFPEEYTCRIENINQLAEAFFTLAHKEICTV